MRREDELTSRGPSPFPFRSDFKDQLAAVIPHLRAFGRSLSGSRDLADDLSRRTLLKAWASRSAPAGTNWGLDLHHLRNRSEQMRLARFKGEWDYSRRQDPCRAASHTAHRAWRYAGALMHCRSRNASRLSSRRGGLAYEEALPSAFARWARSSRSKSGPGGAEALLTGVTVPSRASTKPIRTCRRCRTSSGRWTN